ncbi:unnamed protein product [Rotaria sp. Silwood1]|nr:unnamed protein product [Rotaria sp. Silwood1]
MGCFPSLNSCKPVSQPSHSYYQSHQPKKNQGRRVNIRLVMTPADNDENRNSNQTYRSIPGYKETPVATLEQACEGLQISHLRNYVAKAKNYSKNYKNPTTKLDQDEIAAINLYTQPTPFYHLLNDALRKNDGCTLMPWNRYLKLFRTTLHKLLPQKKRAWCPLLHGLNVKYDKDRELVWWTFSSSTRSLDIFETSNVLGDTGASTLFMNDAFNGRLISEYSEFATEDEILLFPGTNVRVIGELKKPGGLHITHLKQIEPSSFLFELSEQIAHKLNSTPQNYQQTKNFIGDDAPNEPHSYGDNYSKSKNPSTTDSLSAFIMQIQIAKKIPNDAEKAKVLEHLLANQNLSDEIIAGVAECVETMSSSKQMGDVLRLIAKRSELSEIQFRVSVKATGAIANGYEKGSALRAFSMHEQFTVQHLDVVLSVAATISSSTDMANVFIDLANNRYLNSRYFPSILYGIKEIANGNCKSNVLCKLAPRLPRTDANVLQAYLMAANSISSSAEKARATKALM